MRGPARCSGSRSARGFVGSGRHSTSSLPMCCTGAALSDSASRASSASRSARVVVEHPQLDQPVCRSARHRPPSALRRSSRRRRSLPPGAGDVLRRDVRLRSAGVRTSAGMASLSAAHEVRTRSKKVDKAWLHDHLTDPYVKLAQKDGYRARAAYKLQQIDEQFKLVRPGQLVVDLGAAPGAWSQYLRRRFAPSGAAAGALDGTIIALDMLDSSRSTASPSSAAICATTQRWLGWTVRSAPGRWILCCRTWRPICPASRAPTRPVSRIWWSWPSTSPLGT